MPSGIEWTDETWNPVAGCTRVSPGCDNCYMYALYPRLHAMGVPGYGPSPEDVTPMPERLGLPLKWKKPRRVFVNSMADLFHSEVSFEFIYAIFEVMRDSSIEFGHVFQVLTKRPGRAVGWWKEYEHLFPEGWPPNVWIGTSVESQKYAPRLTVLERLPARVRFVSAEPLLERLDLTPWLERGVLQWVIVGGESGRGARPMEIDWAVQLKEQSTQFGVKFFLKQLGGVRNKRGRNAATIDGETWTEVPNWE